MTPSFNSGSDDPRPQSHRELRHTKIRTLLFENSKQADVYVAETVATLIRENNKAGLPTVLGLPTGSTPIGIYRELIRMRRKESLDFSRVITFNLDEYWPMEPDSVHSYRRWMQESFFKHVNILSKNIHIPQGDLARNAVEKFCESYERKIKSVGGIQLQLLGIGRTGHIGFNEPGSSRDTTTRLVTLDPVTRSDAAGDFFGEENVPTQAITMESARFSLRNECWRSPTASRKHASSAGRWKRKSLMKCRRASCRSI